MLKIFLKVQYLTNETITIKNQLQKGGFIFLNLGKSVKRFMVIVIINGVAKNYNKLTNDEGAILSSYIDAKQETKKFFS
ncbi:hypothetical protein GY31_13375 [Lysinibacillus sphaericus]|nr:hypothetical protein GY31_13375 [Lysinibacillus sphaericus]